MNVRLQGIRNTRGVRGLGATQSDLMVAQYQLALAAGDPLAVAASTAYSNAPSQATQYLVNILNANQATLTPTQNAMLQIGYPTQSGCTGSGGTWANGACTMPTYGAANVTNPTSTTSPAGNPLLSQTNPVAGGAVSTSASNPFSDALTTVESGNFDGIPYWLIGVVAIGAYMLMSKKR